MDASIPDKLYYKIGEVSKITGVKPHVLRYWESEFKALSPVKNKAGQRIYTQEDVDLILKIKDLLYKDKFTIAGAKKEIAKRATRKRDKAPSDTQLALKLESEEAESIRKTLDTVKRELQEILSLLES